MKSTSQKRMEFSRGFARLSTHRWTNCPWQDGQICMYFDGLRYVVQSPNFDRDEEYTGLKAVDVIKAVGRAAIE